MFSHDEFSFQSINGSSAPINEDYGLSEAFMRCSEVPKYEINRGLEQFLNYTWLLIKLFILKGFEKLQEL